ncbi:unnamed protein product [Linum trigynum]|uniref:Retrovirus-related Pol polyprotein from transposon TNT 1-94-like beta-barrel domain-containing protein n=1 Tax=Linum trigynum TaxID=586398 RepID=A0AAV2GGE8_9ROSI
MKGYWEEYMQFSPLVPCNRAPGNPNPCAAVTAYTERQETDYLIRFLRGLNPDYEVVKTQILMQKPLPSVYEVVDDLLQHEQKLKGEAGGNSKKSQSVALAVNSDQNTEQRQQGKKYCEFCKRTGHNIDECWTKKRKDKEQRNGNNAGNTQGRGPSRFAGSVSQGSSGESQREGSVTGDTSDGSPVSTAKSVVGFTPEEMNKLRFMMQSSANIANSPPPSPYIHHNAYSVSQYLPPFPNYSGNYVLSTHNNLTNTNIVHFWILDTGASDHISCSLALFTECQPVVNTYVYLPNTTKVLVTHVGTVKLPSGM